jgi:Flp pilus assembly protein TadG
MNHMLQIEDAMMIVRRLVSALRRHSGRLASDQRGVSAIEFALLMPLMLTMYFGSIEVTDAVSADRQVTLVASTVADMASEYTSVADADIANIMQAACYVMAPFPISNATVVLSSVTFTNGIATIAWSFQVSGNCTTVTTGHAIGTNVTTLIPTALNITGTSVLWGECTYNYKPMIGYVVTGTLTMYNEIFMRPRLSTSVTYSG